MKSKNHDLFEHALANPLRVALNVERTGDHGDSYTITLGPGQVRYLNAFDFFGADAEAVIKTIEAASSTVSISSAPWRMRHPDILGNNTVFESEQVDALLKVATWQDRLKVHHALGRLWIQESMPPHVYVLFHNRLELQPHFAIKECLEAWVRGSATNVDLANSYRSSAEHLFVSGDSWSRHAVFARTEFVRLRIRAIEQAAFEKAEKSQKDQYSLREAAEAERLRKSRFTSFVYIMEDTRKKVFKIGRSRTPGKRERTLQSEVPETVLRFCIPAEETHEKELHARFAHRRIRGEWFELTEEDLVAAISFLKSNGDADRAEADLHWLGAHFLRAG